MGHLHLLMLVMVLLDLPLTGVIYLTEIILLTIETCLPEEEEALLGTLLEEIKGKHQQVIEML